VLEVTAAQTIPRRQDLPGEQHEVRRRVLVVGAGFIGSATVRALLDRGHAVVALTRSSPDQHQQELLSGASVILGDASEMGTLAAAITGVDHVVYAVGSSSPAESNLDPASDISVVVPPLVRLLELLRLRPEIGITFLSSGGTVYGNCDSLPIPESTSPKPISSYGILKLTSEKYLEMYADLYDIPVRILRVGNAYGPGQPGSRSQGVVAWLLRSAMTGESVPLFGSGANLRDYIHIDDIADAIAQLVGLDGGPRILNLGTGVGHSVASLVEIVSEITGRRIEAQLFEARTFDVGTNVLDVTQLQALIDFEARDIRTGLKQTWASIEGLSVADVPAPTPPRVPTWAR
jgi:UDP-glucose 4-epimerase